MLKCKNATLTPEGGVSMVWINLQDPTEKYEIYIPPETAEAIIYYDNFLEENKKE